MTNAELLQRLRSLSEQVPEGEWVNVTDTDSVYSFVYLKIIHGVTRHVHEKAEIELACTLRNALPQILEALSQSEVSDD